MGRKASIAPEKIGLFQMFDRIRIRKNLISIGTSTPMNGLWLWSIERLRIFEHGSFILYLCYEKI